MLQILMLIVFGYFALLIVGGLLVGIGECLGALFSGLSSSPCGPSPRRSTSEPTCEHGPNTRIETLRGSGGYCRDCEIERNRIVQRRAQPDWEARKIELRRDHPPSAQR